MSLQFIGARLKSIILVILGAFRRALCCFRKKRRMSIGDSEPLTTVGVVPSYSNQYDKSDQMNWVSWEDKPVTVQDHIERYRQQRNVREPTPEPPQDFFQDMTPKLTRQPKVLIGQQNASNEPDMSRLAVNADVPFGDELEAWDEGENAWEGETDNTLELIREQRRQERLARAQKSQMKRDPRPSGLGSRVSVS